VQYRCGESVREPVINKTSCRLLLLGIVVLFYGALAALWLAGSADTYTRATALWGVRAVNLPHGWYTRNPVPFLDMGSVLSWRECSTATSAAAREAACNPLGSSVNYPPLWQYMPTQWIGVQHTVWAGLALGLIFLGSILVTLRPRDGPELAIAAAACMSHVTVFAVERANIDVLMFLLALAAVSLWRRHRAILSFLVIMTGGFLKFYPFVLLLLLLREPLRRFAVFVAATLLIGIAYTAWTWNYLSHMGHSLPLVFYFSDMFGAMVLPLGLADGLGLPPFAFRILLGPILLAGLWAAIKIAARCGRDLAGIDWNDKRLSQMLGGAVIMASCFVLGASVDYRAIFLLPVLPGLMTLRKQVQDREFSRLLTLGVAATLFCLYSELVRADLVAGLTVLFGHAPASLLEKLPLVACFLLREAVWWFEAVLLAGLALHFVRCSEALRDADAFLVRRGKHA
jgi:hypothetical protein